MNQINRRSFLVRGSAGLVGAAAVTGGALAVVGSNDSAAPLTADELEALDQPIMLQVRDASTGEVQLLVGEREVMFVDRSIVANVLRATR